MMRWLVALTVLLLVVGCGTTRDIRIATEPSGAVIKIDGMERGRSPIRESFLFDSQKQSYRITAQTPGYQDEHQIITAAETRSQITIRMRPQSKRVTIRVSPPAIVEIAEADGDAKPKRLNEDPGVLFVEDLTFTVDERREWTKYRVTAHREGFLSDSRIIAFTDQSDTYTLQLRPYEKPLQVTTDPPGATIYLNEEEIGASPLNDPNRTFAFDYDPINERFYTHELKAAMPGYEPRSLQISWDDGREKYHIQLAPYTKTVRIKTDPPGGSVFLDGKEMPKDSDGTTIIENLQFPPVDEGLELRSYEVVAKKRTEDAEWYDQPFVIEWDDGREDYTIPLREIRTVEVPLLHWRLERDDAGWRVVPEQVMTIAAKDTDEGQHRPQPVRLTQLPPGSSIGTLVCAPDGQRVLMTVLSMAGQELRSQMLAVHSDASGAADILSDGQSLDLTPAFSPDGREIFFSSDRAGRRNIWSISAAAAGGLMQQRTGGDAIDLWPSVDSEPSQRMFYQRLSPGRDEPRLFVTQLASSLPTDLAVAGTQPRISPTNDYILFCDVNPRTGQRDIYRASDRGGQRTNITNTPDIDECDPAWSPEGGRIAFAAPSPVKPRTADGENVPDEEHHENYDIWIADLSTGAPPIQVTTNSSHDDSPQWDPRGNGIYFRSNRGGQWGIWRIQIPE